MLIYIMKQKGQEYNIRELKQMIWDAYKEFTPDNNKKIIKLLQNQGKRTIIKHANNDLNTLIMSEEYFLTTLDVWVFAQKYKVPIILFYSKNIMMGIHNEKILHKNDTDDSNSWIVLGYDKGVEDEFYFYQFTPDTTDQHKIPENKLIEKPFHINQLKSLSSDLDFVIRNNHLLPFGEFLNQIPK